MAQIIWTEPARADLDEIAEYIASDNSDAASRLIRKILETVERLGAYPKSGRYLPELGKGSAYREVIVGSYRVFYCLENDYVYVLHVMRGERSLRIFLLEDRKRKTNG